MRYNKLLSDFKRENVYIDIIKAGYTSDDIKEMVIEIIDEFFINKTVLIEKSINILLTETIALTTLKRESKYFNYFKN